MLNPAQQFVGIKEMAIETLDCFAGRYKEEK